MLLCWWFFQLVSKHYIWPLPFYQLSSSQTTTAVHSQEEASTTATPGNAGGEVQPDTVDRGAPKPRTPMCPSLIKFLSERGFNFNRRPSTRNNLPDDTDGFRLSPSNFPSSNFNPSTFNPSSFNPSSFNPSTFNPQNYNPFGRRSWRPQGRREGSRGGFGGPTFDIPNRDDVEFL